MTDSFTEVTNESWFGRLGGALKGIVFGVVLFGAAFVVLWWNEGRTVDTARNINFMNENAVSTSAETVNPANEGKLVHMTGEATTDETLRDPMFGIEQANMIKLNRNVEMYQWEEEEKTTSKEKVGGGKTTTKTYEYKKDWSSSLNRSSNFKKPSGHENPQNMPVNNLTEVADEVDFGAFTLPDTILRKWNNDSRFVVEQSDLNTVPQNTKNDLDSYWKSLSRQGTADLKVSSGQFVLSKNIMSPEIGDLRVSFSVVKPGTVSLVAKQVGSTFEQGYRPGSERPILEFKPGAHSLESMVAAAKKKNKMIAWLLRFGGWLIMTIGMTMIVAPLRIMASIIPFMGRLVGGVLGFFCALIAAALSLLTIAIAWVAYRPVLGISLLLISAILIAGGFMLVRSRKEAAATEM